MQSPENVNTNLASQEYWDEAYKNYTFEDSSDEDQIVQWIKKYIPPTTNGSCFEVGCFPGRYLTVFGKLNYELNGLDLTPRIKKDFPEWLKSKGYKTGQFEQTDFLKFNPDRKFDVVCSFGFIEHFTNWEEVFEKHISLVKENGYLVIETPNFRGFFQRLIHYYLDNKNYKRHYVPSMNPKKWEKLCRKHGFKIVYSGYMGNFQFWVDEEPTTYFKRKIFLKLIEYYPKLQKLKPGRASYSPYCGIIAKLEK